tara:strand:- start:2 stop:223 length:222 start_codon:yes stop_codon:yes gene_type:complete
MYLSVKNLAQMAEHSKNTQNLLAQFGHKTKKSPFLIVRILVGKRDRCQANGLIEQGQFCFHRGVELMVKIKHA